LAALRAANLFWVLICPDASGDSYSYKEEKENSLREFSFSFGKT